MQDKKLAADGSRGRQDDTPDNEESTAAPDQLQDPEPGALADEADEARAREDEAAEDARLAFVAQAMADVRRHMAAALALSGLQATAHEQELIAGAWRARMAAIAADDDAAHEFRRDLAPRLHPESAIAVAEAFPTLRRPLPDAARFALEQAVERRLAGAIEEHDRERARDAISMAADFVDEEVGRGTITYVRRDDSVPVLRVHSLADLARRETPPRRWIVQDWLPARCAAVLGGHGGIGKSMLVARLATCVALGRPFFGVPTQRGAVVIYSAEDEPEEWVRRLRDAASAEASDLSALDITLIDVTDCDAILFGRIDGKLTTTGRYEQLRARAVAKRAALVVIDGASDAFGGDDIRRAEVRGYLAATRRIAVECGGVALNILHVDKGTARAGERSVEHYSGSTAWNNSARARLAFYRPREEADEDGEAPPDDGARVLELAKSNYGPDGATIALRFDPALHSFRRDGDDTPLVASIRRGNDERDALRFLARCAAGGQPAYSSPTTSESAPVRRAEDPDCPPHFRGRPGRKRFAALLKRMRDAGLIESVQWRTPSRHYVAVWSITPAGRALIGEA